MLVVASTIEEDELVVSLCDTGKQGCKTDCQLAGLITSSISCYEEAVLLKRRCRESEEREGLPLVNPLAWDSPPFPPCPSTGLSKHEDPV